MAKHPDNISNGNEVKELYIYIIYFVTTVTVRWLYRKKRNQKSRNYKKREQEKEKIMEVVNIEDQAML